MLDTIRPLNEIHQTIAGVVETSKPKEWLLSPDPDTMVRQHTQDAGKKIIVGASRGTPGSR